MAGIGAGYLLKLTLVLIALMVINSWLIGQAVFANLHSIPRVLHDVRLFQFFQIFGAFLLLGVEFAIYDRIVDRLAGHRSPGGDAEDGRRAEDQTA